MHAAKSAKKTKEVSTGYVPRPFQAVIHKNLKRFSVIVCHRRFGKTHLAINELIDRGLRLMVERGRTDRLRPRYAYIAPTYGQAKKVAWDIFKSYTASLPGVSVNEAELRIDVDLFGDPNNTLRFQLLGAERPDSLRGIYLDGAVIDEVGDVSPTVWTQAIRPTLSDRIGWALFIGTPKGRNFFFDLHEYAKTADNWFTKVYKASETGVIDPGELVDAKRTMSSEEFAQEYECSFEGSTIGSYYGDLMRDAATSGRVRPVPYDPAVPVFTAWDLGISDEMAVWFYQKIFREVHVLNYLELSGKGIPFMAKTLKEMPYSYGAHFFPHDGAARELGTGKTRQEVAESLGLRPVIIAKRQAPIDGINAVRNLLPRVWFDEEKTKRGRVCLEEYKKKWDEKLQTFTDKPVHDQYSHGADAFRCLAMTLDSEPWSRENLPEEAEMDYDHYGRH